MKRIRQFAALIAAFWCCFWHEGELIRGNPIHFEGWFDEQTGEEQMIIYFDLSGESYTVDMDDLIMIYYDDDIGMAIG